MNKPLQRLIVATNNAHKLDEIKHMLAGYFEVVGMTEAGFTDDIPEDADTFKGNALIKARAISEKTGSFCIADDSGLEVNSLEKRPGVYSARYAGEPKDDQKNMDKVLYELEGIQDRSARFVTALAYVREGLEYVFEGDVKGTIIREPRGTNGFGYDPVFVPNGFDKTFAEMSSGEKNALSHRARAIENFLEFIEAE